MADAAARPGGCRRWARRLLPKLLTAVLLPLAVLVQIACGTGGPSSPGATWGDGPVRWLMLPEEQRQFRRLHGSRETVLFIELFWRRRDPTPLDPGNPFLEVFHERVQAADRLYGEEETRGSLTDRGGALILFGPPPILRHRQRSVVALLPNADPRNLLEAEAETSIAVEEWEYPPEALPSILLEMLDEEARVQGILLTFAEGPRRTRLVEGEEYLGLAARALATQQLKLWK